MEPTFLKDAIINMTIASYMHRPEKADVQVKRMAKRYMNQTKEKLDRRVLRRVVKCPKPCLLVQISYDELLGSGSQHWQPATPQIGEQQ